MKKQLYILLTFVIFAAVTQTVNGQGRYRGPYKPTNYTNSIKVVGGTGFATYFGDLCETWECWNARPQGSIGLRYRYNKGFSFRSSLAFYQLYASDENGINERRNLSFRGDNFEFTASVIYDLFKYNRIYMRRYDWTPYLMVGAGATYYVPKAKYKGDWHKLRPLQTEGQQYSKISPVWTYGGGVRFKVSPHINISTEVAYRHTFTDYLDDVSTEYVDNSEFDDPVAAALADRTSEGGYDVGDTNDGTHWAAGHKRGNPGANDGYFMFSVKIDYTIKVTKQFRKNVSYEQAKLRDKFFIK